jgi:hypothetical protein
MIGQIRKSEGHMGQVGRPHRHGPVLLAALLALLTQVPHASAQDRPKIEVVPIISHTQPVYSVAFSPDGARVLSGSGDNTMKLWDAATGGLLRTFEGHSSFVISVAFSPDGARVLSGSHDKTLKLWDAATGQLLRTFEGHSSFVISVAFSPDGARVLSGSHDKTLKLWDAATGGLLRTFEGHSSGVRSVAFSPDGARVLSGSDDTSVRIWNVATGQPLVSLFAAPDTGWLAITPAGFFDASRKGTEMLGVVRGFEVYSVMQFYDHLHRPDLIEEVLKGDPESKYKDAARRINLERVLDSGDTPGIKLLKDRTEKSGETVKLAARLNDEGGGIGAKVIWRVNGKTQGATTAPGLGGPPSVGRYVVMSQTLTVDPTKKNEVEIIAYNSAGRLATQPFRFAIDPWGVAEKERPRMFVLAVGVDKYVKTDWQLRYAAKDASSFAAAMKLVGSPLFSEVQVKTLLDAAVTERGIAAEFERLSSIVKARDVFVLFLGGHGRSIAGEGWFYLPQDLNTDAGHTIEKNGIGPGKLQAWMAKIPAEKSLVILDACESGASEAFRGGDRERETVMAQLEHATGRNIIAAAPAGKAAYEGYQGHGILTYAILEALHKHEGAVEEAVSVFGIAAHVSRQVPAISQRQFGFLQKPQPKLTDDFPLGVRKAVLTGAPMLISTTPTHVNTALLKVFKEVGGKGGVVQQLPPFTPVTLVKRERGWAHIARDGKALGYVPEGKLQKLALPAAPEPASTAPTAKPPATQPVAPARPKRAKKSAPSKDADEPSLFWKN